jgi:hypothetical protein
MSSCLGLEERYTCQEEGNRHIMDECEKSLCRSELFEKTIFAYDYSNYSIATYITKPYIPNASQI